jgi:hypothetical protein
MSAFGEKWTFASARGRAADRKKSLGSAHHKLIAAARDNASADEIESEKSVISARRRGMFGAYPLTQSTKRARHDSQVRQHPYCDVYAYRTV